METELERIAEHIIDVPMPQILEEITEFESIVDIPDLQIEFILFDGSFFFCCGMERCTPFDFSLIFQFSVISTSRRRIVVIIKLY